MMMKLRKKRRMVSSRWRRMMRMRRMSMIMMTIWMRNMIRRTM